VIADLIDAMSMAAVLTPLAISLSLLYRVSGVVNFGSGYFCVFAGAACAQWGAKHAGLGVLTSLVAGCVVGALAYLVAIVPARVRGVPPIGLTISTLGFGLLLSWVTTLTFGGDPSIIQPWVAGTTTWAGKTFANQRLLLAGLALLLLLLLWLLFDRTLIGRILGAVAFDNELASMYGVRAARFELLAWVVSGFCVSVAGIFQASIASVSLANAPSLLLYALVGAVVGALGSLGGSVGGAVVLSLVIAVVTNWLGGGHELTASFLLLFVVLLFRARGLFARRLTAERV
jgi:branched-subunit amino acid ABC-type transport system permease component